MRLAHHHSATTRDAARSAPERSGGAALVELAFVAVLLIMISAGAYDYGLAYRQALSVNEAARTGVRTGSALGKNAQADYYALTGAKAALAASNTLDEVQKVVIYKSSTVDGNPPSTCINNTTSTDPCVVLTGDQFRSMTLSSFDGTTGCFTAATIKTWCPSNRNNIQLSADYYGIWIQAKYMHQFKILSPSTTISRDAVMRLEPDVP